MADESISSLLYALNGQFQRWKATGKVSNYGINPFPHQSSSHIAFILGFTDGADMRNNWSDKTSRLVRQMLGLHGLTVYKVLLTQAIDREEQKHAD